jgi:hypothetical protein
MSFALSAEISDFWRWFVKHEEKLKKIRSAEDAEYEELERRVAEINEELSVEMGGSEGSGEISLVFTAHGNERVFPIVDALVKGAPRIAGWQLHALKPPLLENFEIQYERNILRTGDVLFKILTRNTSSGKLSIEIACAGCKDEECAHAALLVLESFIGERACALSVEVEEVIPLPENPSVSGLMTIRRLAEILGIDSTHKTVTSEPMVRRYDISDTTLTVVIEDDDRVAYAYLTDEGKIVSDVWLYNVAPTPKTVDWRDKAQMPFLNPKKFCKEEPVFRISERANLFFSSQAGQVNVTVDGQLIARLQPNVRPGWSKLAARKGPLALPLD